MLRKIQRTQNAKQVITNIEEAIKKHTWWDNGACATIGMSNTKLPNEDEARVAQTLGEH